MESCIFCQLKNDKSAIIYENEECFVVLDKYPIEKGHLLVISKEHYENMLDAPDSAIASMFIVAKIFAKRLKEVLGANSVNIGTNVGRLAGQRIMHFHVHVVPRYPGTRRSFDYGHGRELSEKEKSELMSKLKTSQ
ncbi:MAG: HIT family protein [Candidatus Micrarchaeia archaeon]